MSQQPTPSPAPMNPLLICRIIWLAMVMAVIGYGIVTVAVPGGGSDAGRTLTPIFAAVGAALAVASFVIRTILSKILSRAGAAPGAMIIPYVVAFAMAEAVAIFGLLLHFLGESQPVALSFFGVGLAVLALHFPMSQSGR